MQTQSTRKIINKKKNYKYIKKEKKNKRKRKRKNESLQNPMHQCQTTCEKRL